MAVERTDDTLTEGEVNSMGELRAFNDQLHSFQATFRTKFTTDGTGGAAGYEGRAGISVPDLDHNEVAELVAFRVERADLEWEGKQTDMAYAYDEPTLVWPFTRGNTQTDDSHNTADISNGVKNGSMNPNYPLARTATGTGEIWRGHLATSSPSESVTDSPSVPMTANYPSQGQYFPLKHWFGRGPVTGDPLLRSEDYHLGIFENITVPGQTTAQTLKSNISFQCIVDVWEVEKPDATDIRKAAPR